MGKKVIHIVVQEGLVQSVFSEGVDVEVVIHDLDTEDREEYEEVNETVAQLPDFAKQVY